LAQVSSRGLRSRLLDVPGVRPRPGGFGTLDEIFETVMLAQTGKIRRFPIVAMGGDYWQPMLDFIQQTMFREGTAGAGEAGPFPVTDSVVEAVDHIERTVREAEAGRPA
jgi:predicted Rossmann-fold nucleotide-binding protein